MQHIIYIFFEFCQEKLGNIVVRRKVKDRGRSESHSYKGVGLAPFNLATVVNAYAPSEFTLPLTKCDVNGAIVVIEVTPKYVAEV